MKILVVDDNNDDRKVLRYVLEAHGHEVMEAVNGAEGLQAASAYGFDLVLSDVMMPVMDGFQFLRNLRVSSTVPFIFYSAVYDSSNDMQLATSLGVNGYIIKPKAPLELMEEIERIVCTEPTEKSGVIEGDAQYLKRYSQVVVSKLEEKILALEGALAELNQSKDLLLKREQEFRSLAENMPDNIVRYDREGLTLYVNPSLERTLGMPAESTIGKSPMELHPDGGFADYIATLKNVIATGIDAEIEMLVPDGSGDFLHHQVRFVTERDSEGTICSILAIGRDITDQLRAKQRLQQAHEFTGEIINSIPDPIFVKDRQHRFYLVNNAFCSFTGHADEELLGKSDYDFFPKKEADEYCSKDELVFNSDRTNLNEETLTDAVGNRHFIQTRKASFVAVDGREFLVGVIRDISERKLAEEALLDKQQRLSDMTVELSLAEERERRRIAAELHDNIGQTLLLGKMKLGSLVRTIPPGIDKKEYEEILTLQEQVIRAVRSLTQQLSPPILTGAGLEAALEWLGKRMDDDFGLQVTFVDDRKPKPLSEDIRAIVFQACRELLINVAKHAETESARVTVGRECDMLYLTVEDRGRGFDPVKGAIGVSWDSGFGLFNIRERLKHLGGELTLESAPGLGTRVTLRVGLTVNKELL